MLASEQPAGAPPTDPLRILLVTSDKFPPFRPAAKAIFAEGLAAAGHRIDWLMQAEKPDTPSGYQSFAGGVASIAATNAGETRLARLRKYWLDFRNDLRVFRLIRSRDYSLVQIKDKYLGALPALLAAKLHGVPVFYWLAYPHGEASLYAARNGVARYNFFYSLRGRVQRWLLYRVIMPACEHVFVQSEQMRADVAREGIPYEQMTAVPSSLNLDDVDAAVDVPAPALRGPAIVYLGTLLRERRLDFLVRVLAKVRRAVPNAELLFVGRGEMPDDEALLWSEADRQGVRESVTITGWLPMPVAWSYVRSAAVCVSPYYPVPILRSTSPTKLVEYMALGKAVVANDHPEQADVVKRSGAGLLCAWDEDEFAAAIVRLLEDPARTAAMGRAGRDFVARYRTHWAMVDLVVSRYREALAARSPDGSRPTVAIGRVGAARD
jgi:glycosyltransferase involved in cell wall biosynthesis